MLIHPETLKLTTVAGAASGNTQTLMGICYEVLVKPAAETTQYDIAIINAAGIEVYARTSETGTLAESTILPVKDVYTVHITNATKQELFIIELMIREN